MAEASKTLQNALVSAEVTWNESNQTRNIFSKDLRSEKLFQQNVRFQIFWPFHKIAFNSHLKVFHQL